MRALWTAATGMEGQQIEIDNIANNLANTNTTGYKQSRVNFEDLFYQTVKSPGAYSSQYVQSPTGIQIGLGTKVSSIEKEFTQGDLQQTSNPLDIAISGQGFFQIQMSDGETAYTRDGTFQTNSQGQLVHANGNQLVPPITIPPNATSVTISENGTVSAAISGQTNPAQVGNITLVNFINPAGLSSIGNNLYLQTSASGVPQIGTPNQNGLGTIQQGFLEMSNVNLVGQMVSMITAQNAYTIDSKAITAATAIINKPNRNINTGKIIFFFIISSYLERPYILHNFIQPVRALRTVDVTSAVYPYSFVRYLARQNSIPRRYVDWSGYPFNQQISGFSVNRNFPFSLKFDVAVGINFDYLSLND